MDDAANDGLTEVVMDVYASKDGGWWNPDHGDVEIPDGWAFLPAGDAYLTRTVTAAGQHWIAWRPGDRRRRRRRRRLGVWAPEATIEYAEARAEATAEQRAEARERATRTRAVAEDRYRDELAQAIEAWLDFADDYVELAREIARQAAAHAAVVGSGRVGRTSTLDLHEKAMLAARAFIRHHHTDYDDRLIEAEAEVGLLELDPEMYGMIRRDAHDAVDRFLVLHRQVRDHHVDIDQQGTP